MAKRSQISKQNAELKKRKRDQEDAEKENSSDEGQSSGDNSDSSSSSDDETTSMQIVKKRSTATKKQEPLKQAEDKDEDDEDEEDDSSSSDEETEKMLFRPVADVKADDDERDDESEEDNEHNDKEVDGDDDDSEEKAKDSKEESEEEEEQQTETKVEAKKKRKKAQAAAEDVDEGINQSIEQEIQKKTEATIYVEGIPYKADEGDVVSHFASCGIVKEVRMPRYQDSGRPRGYAHVVFESENSIEKALKLNGKYLMGRYLTIQAAEKPRMMEMALKNSKQTPASTGHLKGCRTVFVKQLPYDVEEDAVRKALESCGNILSVRLPLWNHTKKLKGFGYVEFSKPEEALAAVKKTGMKIGNRMVLISLDTGAPKASFRQRDGQYWIKDDSNKQLVAKKIGEQQAKKHANDSKAFKKAGSGHNK